MSLLIKALKQAEKRHQEATAQAIEQVSADPTMQAAASAAAPRETATPAAATNEAQAPVVTAGSFAAMSLSLTPADAPDATSWVAAPAAQPAAASKTSESVKPAPQSPQAATKIPEQDAAAAKPSPVQPAVQIKTNTFKPGVRSSAQVQGIARPRWLGSRWVRLGAPIVLAIAAGTGWLTWQMWGGSPSTLVVQPPPPIDPGSQVVQDTAQPASDQPAPRAGRTTAPVGNRLSATGPAIRGNDVKSGVPQARDSAADPAQRTQEVGPKLAMAADTSDAVQRSLQRLTQPANPASALAPRVETPSSTAASGTGLSSMRITRNDTQERVARLLDQAYAALTRQERRTARQLYEQALELDRLNPDAWLGLASLSAREGDLAAAERHYNKVLDIDPNDSAARAGLVSLRVAADPSGQESQLRHLLAGDPAQPSVQFALGNSLAAQGRWADAQQAYFQAYSGDPQNPDYAFNLAISLERLRQPATAITFYKKALELGQSRQARFKPDQVNKRIAELERTKTTRVPDAPSVHPNSSEAVAARD